MKKEHVYLAIAASLLALASAAAAQTQARPLPEIERQCENYNKNKHVYFGDLHSHTAFSYDAITLGTWGAGEDGPRSTPRTAFAFARGAEVDLPPYDARTGEAERHHQLKRELDFLAVTDHAEFFGEVHSCFICAPGAEESDGKGDGGMPCEEDDFVNQHEICQQLRADARFANVRQEPLGLSFAAFAAPMDEEDPTRPLMCEGAACLPETVSVWGEVQAAANEAYMPCEFTAFVAYEWSGVPDGANMHRNVIFRNHNVPGLPITYVETGDHPEELWQRLDFHCKKSTPGCDVLAIPHNSNLSFGRLLPRPADAEAAEFQAEFERLAEIHQTKGNSECRWGVGNTDEMCQLELLSKLDLAGAMPAYGPLGSDGSLLPAEYQGFEATPDTGGTYNFFLRELLKAGLYLGDDPESGDLTSTKVGVNPYKLGFVGGTDTHVGTPGATEEDDYQGHHGVEDYSPEKRLSGDVPRAKDRDGIDQAHARLEDNPAGLTAVWADQNTRDSIFDSLRNRETYATSGIRPTVRFFGGWDDLDDLECGPSFARLGYENGVPMGSDLGIPEGDGMPRFAVKATKDPDYDAKLQRIQIIKGWIDAEGVLHEKVYDVTSAPAVGQGPASEHIWPLDDAYIDRRTCKLVKDAPGKGTLCAVWVDHTFKRGQSAFYYARVLENPTCRWSTYDCIKLNDPTDACWDRLETPAGCDDGTDLVDCDLPGVTVGLTIQERAWTSPIWYEPVHAVPTESR